LPAVRGGGVKAPKQFDFREMCTRETVGVPENLQRPAYEMCLRKYGVTP
jgi:hypothetical protein